MNRILLSAVFMMFSIALYATEYYSQGNGSVNNLSIWNSARNGSGTTPTDFTGENDVFIIQSGHQLNTISDWNISGSGSIFRIEEGTLIANHNIELNHFEILAKGVYLNNYAGKGALSANSFSFHPASIVEIKNWIAQGEPLPDIDWGNLLLSFISNPSGGWTFGNSIKKIQGDFIIRSASDVHIDLSHSESYSLIIEGSLKIESGNLNSNWNLAMEIAQNLIISEGAVFNLTENFGLNNFNLYVNGNVQSNGSIISSGSGALINIGGVNSEISGNFDIGIRILPNSLVSLSGDLTMSGGFIFVIAGQFNSSGYNIDLNESYLVISGGKFTSSGIVQAGNTAVCTGDGTIEPLSTFGYCSLSGSVGEMNLDGGTIQIPSGGNRFFIGEPNSPGRLLLSNNAVVEGTGVAMPAVAIEVNKNSYLEFDAESKILGNANFSTNDAHIVIASLEGIRSTVMGGNVQVSGSRNFSNSAGSVYEYKSEEMQVTGNGLPGEMFGKVIFKNTEGVFLSSPLIIKSGGSLELNSGIVTVSGSGSLIFEHEALLLGGGNNAFVNGSISKIGMDNFIFHVGRDNIYSPVEMREFPGAGGKITDHYRVSYFPIKATTQFEGIIHSGEIDHLSSNDTWLIEKLSGDLEASKRFYVTFSERSGVDNLSSLTISYRDGEYYRRLTNAVVTGTTTSGTISFIPLLYGPFTLASTDMMNPLPVVLTDFTAEKSSFKALLKWNVTPDSNPEYFEILHAGADQNYTVLAKLNAGEYQQSYQYFHHSPFKGDNFYQLRITDKQGIVSLSKIQSVSFELEGNSMALYPSYGTASNLMIASSEKAYMKLQIRNQNGQLLNGYDIQLEKGNNNFFIDMNKYPAGVYMISVYEGNKLIDTKRFIKR